jgi:hypothetical protein
VRETIDCFHCHRAQRLVPPGLPEWPFEAMALLPLATNEESAVLRIVARCGCDA